MFLGIPYWIFILIALGILLLVIVLIFVYCATKKSRKKAQDIRFKQNLKNYIDRSKATEQRIVNLEDVPDPTLSPMIQNQESKEEAESESNQDDPLSGSIHTLDVQTFSNSFQNSPKAPDSPDMPSLTVQKNSELAKSTGYMNEYSQKSTTMKSSSTTMMYYESGMIRSTFKPQEPSLTLRRNQPIAPLRMDAPNTLPRPGGDILRLGGITQFPVMSPPPAGFEADPAIPGRKTSFINYMNPKEL